MTISFLPRALLASFLVVLHLSVPSSGRLTAEPPPREKKASSAAIMELIKQLDSPDAVTRQTAAGRLSALPEAIPSLRQAVNSTDSDLIRAAKPVLREALLRRARGAADGCPIDLWVERLLRLDEDYEVEACWRVAAERAAKIVQRAKQDFNRAPLTAQILAMMPGYDFDSFVGEGEDKKPFKEGTRFFIGPRQGPPDVVDEVYIIRRESLHLTWVVASCAAAIGMVQADNLELSTLLAGDSVTIRSDLERSIIVADGDIVADRIKDCIIITRGSVRAKRQISGSVVQAGGKVEAIDKDGGALNTIRENDPKLGGWVRFFETADAGLEMSPAKSEVKIATVIDGLPPAKTGLRAGDIVTALDGTAVKDAEQFRRLLRHATVNNSTKFTVRRDNKTLELTTSFVGWEPPPIKR